MTTATVAPERADDKDCIHVRIPISDAAVGEVIASDLLFVSDVIEAVRRALERHGRG